MYGYEDFTKFNVQYKMIFKTNYINIIFLKISGY